LDHPRGIQERRIIAAPACTMFCRIPRSDNNQRTTVTMVAIAITPNISGTRIRVIARLLASRMKLPYCLARERPASGPERTL